MDAHGSGGGMERTEGGADGRLLAAIEAKCGAYAGGRRVLRCPASDRG
jgi:hypothetical protein